MIPETESKSYYEYTATGGGLENMGISIIKSIADVMIPAHNSKQTGYSPLGGIPGFC